MKRKILALLALFIPHFASAKSVTGYASYYGESYDGRLMANGKKFDHRKMTLATHKFPLGTRVKITYLSSQGQKRIAYGIVTDRGPSAGTRLFDLSYGLFKFLESPKKGVIKVTVEEV